MITSDKATGSERFRESASDADGSKVIEAWELVIVAHFSFCNSDIEPVKRTIGFAWLRNHCRKTHGLELILPADKDTKGPAVFVPKWSTCSHPALYRGEVSGFQTKEVRTLLILGNIPPLSDMTVASASEYG